jgi:NADPH:quinone reductase-like Zn-dependent oxidoreductase
MRAIVLDRYGPPERVMRLTEVARPAPRAGEVLVRVNTVSLNSWDADVVGGEFFNRIAAPFRPRHRIIGSDVAGEVVAAGDGSTRHRVGDRVFGELSAAGWGGFAEYVAAPEHALVSLPTTVDDVTAAALPQAASMALQALGDRDALDGCRVLIVGAGGGVGTFALQLAIDAGARVTVVDRVAKLDRLLELGASEGFVAGVIPAEAAGAFDRVLDVVGALSATEHLNLLGPGGTAVAIGGRPRRLLGYALAGARSAQRSGGRRVRLLGAVPNRDLPELAALVAAGSLRAIVDGPHPLDAVPHQVERLRAGEVFGKVVFAP